MSLLSSAFLSCVFLSCRRYDPLHSCGCVPFILAVLIVDLLSNHLAEMREGGEEDELEVWEEEDCEVPESPGNEDQEGPGAEDFA